MIIRRLHLVGFGKFVGHEIDLESGLNVFYGPNESGKTTIQRFLRGMLYGFKEPDARRRRWTADLERYAPWSGKPYIGALEFSTSEGRTYYVERAFAKDQDRVQIFDAVTGRDVSTLFELDVRRERLYAEAFTGMNELVFSSTVCISNMPDISSEKGRQELAARLANLQESADEATSVRRAVDSLESARRTLVTRQNQLQLREEQAHQALETILTHRSAVRQLELQMQDVGHRQKRAAENQREALVALLASDIANLQHRQSTICAMEDQIAVLEERLELLAPYAQVPIELRAQLGQLHTRVEEGEGAVKALGAAVCQLEEQLGRTDQQLQALPGAQGLVPALAADTGYGERARSVNIRLAEAVQHLHEAEQAERRADEEVRRASEDLLPFAPMAELPDSTLHAMAELDASARQAVALVERLQAQSRRRRILAEHLHSYEDRARTAMRQLVDLEIMDALPDHAGRRMEELIAEIQAVTRGMEDTRTAQVTLLRKAAELEEELASYDALSSLPEGIESHVHELELRTRSGEQRLVAVRTLVDQLEAVLDRQNQRRATLQKLEEELEGTQHLALLTLSEVHAAEGWLGRWQAAEEELATAIEAVNAATAADAKSKTAMLPLQAVAAAGIESLTRAEGLVKQEADLRERARQSAAVAETLELPPVGRMRSALALMTPGFACMLLSFIAFRSVAMAGLGLAMILCGVPLLVKGALARRQVIQERDRHYGQRSEANAAAEKVSAEIRALLAEVRQPSVPAWRNSWARLEELQKQRATIQNQLTLATQRRASANGVIIQARQALSAISLPAAVGASDRLGLSKVIRGLGDAIVTRQEQLRDRLAVQRDLADEHARLSTLYDDTVDAIRLLFPDAEPPAEPNIAWVQEMLTTASSLVKGAGRELSSILEAAHVESPAELLHWWRRYQALMLQKEAVASQIREHENRLQAMLSRRRAHEDQVLRWLEMAGIHPGQRETEDELMDLPWTSENIEHFMERHRRYKELRRDVEMMPQELPALVRDAQQLLDEVRSSREATQEFETRLQAVPSLAEPVRQAAAALEKVASDSGLVYQVEGTGLPGLLWSADLDELLADLPTAGFMDRWGRAISAARQQALSLVEAIMEQAGTSDVAAFHWRWQEREHLRQQLGEKERVRAMCQEACERHLARALSLLVGEVEPVLKAAGLSLLGEGAQPADIRVWQETFDSALSRIDGVQEIYRHWIAQAAELQGQREAISERQDALEELVNQRDSLLMQAGVDSVSAFETLCENHLHWKQTVTDLDGKKRQLAAFLGEATLDEISAELQARQEDWSSLTGLPCEQVTPSEHGRIFWEDKLARAEGELTRLRELRAEMAGDMKSHANACEGEERVAAEWGIIKQDREQVQEAIRAVMLARQELDEASEEVHRQFAPVLNAKASEILHTLTHGRYERLAVSETLDIMLQDPEYARPVSLDAVSHGTGDQVYLAFRLAAAEAICGDRWAPPLILDDAFAHYDDHRVREALKTLLQVSQRVQVLFFTCRQRELEILPKLSKETGISWRVVELE